MFIFYATEYKPKRTYIGIKSYNIFTWITTYRVFGFVGFDNSINIFMRQLVIMYFHNYKKTINRIISYKKRLTKTFNMSFEAFIRFFYTTNNIDINFIKGNIEAINYRIKPLGIELKSYEILL